MTKNITYINGYLTKKTSIKKDGKTYYPFIVTTDTIDWVGDKIIPTGIDTSTYLQNPVVFYNHSDNLIIGKSELELTKDGKKLIGYVWFDELSEESRRSKAQVEAGTLKSASIGLQVLEWEDRPPSVEEKAQLTDKPYIDKISEITKSRMLEWSVVTIGMNPDALLYRASQKGMKFEQILNIKKTLLTKKRNTSMARNIVKNEGTELKESLTEIVEELTLAYDGATSFISGVNAAVDGDALIEYVKTNLATIDKVVTYITTAGTIAQELLETADEIEIILDEDGTTTTDAGEVETRFRKLERGLRLLQNKVSNINNKKAFNSYLNLLKGNK